MDLRHTLFPSSLFSSKSRVPYCSFPVSSPFPSFFLYFFISYFIFSFLHIYGFKLFFLFSLFSSKSPLCHIVSFPFHLPFLLFLLFASSSRRTNPPIHHLSVQSSRSSAPPASSSSSSYSSPRSHSALFSSPSPAASLQSLILFLSFFLSLLPSRL